MPYTLELQPERRLIAVTFKGVADQKLMFEIRGKIRPMLEEHEDFHVLVDMQSIEWHMSPREIYEFARTLLNPEGSRIALVIRPNDLDARYFETVARNWSKSIRSFNDRAKALKALGSRDRDVGSTVGKKGPTH